ncbi:MAG: tripartite tricarboxylate transporter TctB family protein [Bosea sp.]|uniref:tripartite tricarboxylate transporter TctB family protein n=1 Tax=Bosea sp. (in: a-proteobacteria) TaxID=1871050 RepID=UPI0010F7032D|nr:tripartite tricarboxylate transporter TctB family protein [Bosea sp. (in: a-proteobacteria)]MCP4734857.1 tripartite tricarboxylate transporter TctB family protein [Bosea sp. (in: a-proteobacteria)]
MRTTAKQLKAGGIFVAIGAFFLATSLSTLEIGSTLRMGPGFLPIVLALVLVALGLGVILERRGGEDEEETRPVPWRGLVFITLAPLLFALLVKGWGLAPALLAMVATSALASRMMRPIQVMIVTVVLTALALLLFSYLLQLPYPLFASTLATMAG